jgi:hypothetical protein
LVILLLIKPWAMRAENNRTLAQVNKTNLSQKSQTHLKQNSSGTVNADEIADRNKIKNIS